MQGAIITIHVDGQITHEKVNTANVLDKLQKIVGGHIESVPYWDHLTAGNQTRRCWAVINEEGKLIGLPMNLLGSVAWYREVPEMNGVDALYGNVAICIGDDEFMAAL